MTGFLTAECVAERWEVRGELCEYAQCEFGEDGWGQCREHEACAVGLPFGGLCARAVSYETGCDQNPCDGKPFTCACAGALCGPYHRCAEAARGEAICEPNTDLEELPVEVAGPHYLAAVVDGRLCSAQQCVDPDTGDVLDLPEGLQSFGGLVQHGGYLYGTDTLVLTRLKIGGTRVETVLDERPNSFALGDPYLYWLARPVGADAADVMRQKLDGSERAVLAGEQGGASHLVLHDQTLYWNAPGGYIRMPLATGKPTFVASAWDGRGTVVDGEALWLDDETQQLQRVDLGTGELTVQPEVQGQALYVDDKRLYVIAPGQQSVSTLHKYLLDGTPAPDEVFVYLLPHELLFDDRYIYWRGCGAVVRWPK